MSAVVLARLRDLFLAPDRAASLDRPATRVTERAVPATLGVLAGPDDAAVAGAALGLAAARAARCGCAVVCVWSGEADDAPGSGAAVRTGRALAARLASRGLAAAARGRLVTVALPAADVEARAAAERALAAAGDVPVIVVVAGARPPALDPLLARVDRVVLVPPPGAPGGLEELAVEAAARLARGTGVLRLPATTSAAGRLLTTAGLALSPALRAVTAAALEGRHG